MKSLTAIRTAAATALGGGALAVLLAFLMIAGLVMAHDVGNGALPSVVVKAIGIAAALVLCGLGVWAVATGGAVLMRRPWARTSMLILGGMMAFLGATSLLVMLFIPLPVDARASAAAVTLVRRSVAACYGALALVGGWWLAVFGGAQGREYFADAAAASRVRRPVSITLIAWGLLITAALAALFGVLQLPGLWFGALATGWQTTGAFLLCSLFHVYLGSGLLQLDSGARRAAIGYFAALAASVAASVAMPGYYQNIHDVTAAYQRLLRIDFFAPPDKLPVAFAALTLALPLWFLLRRGAAFGQR